LDKTGTITKGRPEVTNIISVDKIGENELLEYAASLESGSEHPLASAIVESAKIKNLKITPPADFIALSGKGVKGRINNASVLIGNITLFTDNKIVFEQHGNKITDLENEAKTVILIAINEKFAGIIAIADSLKEDSKQAIDRLKQMNIEVIMLTGDNLTTAQAIADKVGIANIVARVLPAEKQKTVESLQKRFGIVAMVGDGINDAPALKQANIGIAIGTGTDIAIEASDVTLVKGSLMGIVTAVKLSKATFKKTKQNLFWAFFYNIIAIPVAMLGLMHPLIAEIAMALSSINVVTNSVRLKKSRLN
jgi:Cu+-exporting ATPase